VQEPSPGGTIFGAVNGRQFRLGCAQLADPDQRRRDHQRRNRRDHVRGPDGLEPGGWFDLRHNRRPLRPWERGQRHQRRRHRRQVRPRLGPDGRGARSTIRSAARSRAETLGVNVGGQPGVNLPAGHERRRHLQPVQRGTVSNRRHADDTATGAIYAYRGVGVLATSTAPMTILNAGSIRSVASIAVYLGRQRLDRQLRDGRISGFDGVYLGQGGHGPQRRV